jgi:hypothetical protein
MQPAAKITSKDVVIVCTPPLVIDGVWHEQYGAEIEYEFRIIPAQLL